MAATLGNMPRWPMMWMTQTSDEDDKIGAALRHVTAPGRQDGIGAALRTAYLPRAGDLPGDIGVLLSRLS